MSAIPATRALQICEKINMANQRKWFTFKGLWCWGCSRFSKTPQQRCWRNDHENRGCAQVNEVYDSEERLFRRSPQE
jgi:hypothetical protein